MSVNHLPLVMVVGASGMTGRVIVEALLRANKFRVAALARSAGKPILVDMIARGVVVHELDHATATFEELKEVLTGVDTLISTTYFSAIMSQVRMFDAAKAAGVKRVVPDDFATSAPRGIMLLHDQKLAVRDHLLRIEQPATFIEVGYWMQLVAPFPASRSGDPVAQRSYPVYGNGDTATAVTDYDHIGDHVVRIIQDQRTINQTVFVWEDQVSRHEAWGIAERKCDDWPALKKLRHDVSAEETRRLIDEAITTGDVIGRILHEFHWSMYVRGDNTVSNATRLGALDFKELYPDIECESFEEFTNGFYENPPTLYQDGYPQSG